MIEHDALISQYSHEQHRPREGEALNMLRKVASLVKPIMRQRMWRVGVLSEFYPEEKNLLGLNVNGGQKILLRLRQPYDDRQFLSYEQVVDTMLHELCHIVFGPHDQNFHNLWNQLRDEYETLTRKGYTGEGFLSKGSKLGGSRMPAAEVQRQARLAFTKQRQQQGTTGHRLGGQAASKGNDIRAVIANAAQQRRDILTGCATDKHDDAWKDRIAQQASKNGFMTKAEEDDANERAIMQVYIDMIQEEEQEKHGPGYVRPSKDNPTGRRDGNGMTSSATFGPPPVPILSKPKSGSNLTGSSTMDDRPGDSTPSNNSVPPSSSYNEPWTCPVCTLNNPPTYLCCDACTVERPEPLSVPGRQSEPARGTSATKATTSTLKAKTDLKRTSSYTNLQRFTQAAREADLKKPMGWCCHSCGSFMESQWWVCSQCGTMKQSS